MLWVKTAPYNSQLKNETGMVKQLSSEMKEINIDENFTDYKFNDLVKTYDINLQKNVIKKQFRN